MNSCVFIGEFDSDPRGPFTDAPEPLHAGPRAWRWLHLKAIDNGLTAELLRSFTNCVGCGDCRRHFQQLQRDYPFEPKNQFAWTTKVHNEINRSRHVPAMSVEKAKALWTGPRSKMIALGLAAPGVPQFSEVVSR